MTITPIVTLNHPGTSNTYNFLGFLSAIQTVNAQDPVIEGFEGGEQEVIIVRFKYDTRWQLEMLTEDTVTLFDHTAIGKMINFANDVRSLTNYEQSWTLDWNYWDDGSYQFSQQIIGKIISVSWTASGESANLKVKCEFSLAEDTES